MRPTAPAFAALALALACALRPAAGAAYGDYVYFPSSSEDFGRQRATSRKTSPYGPGFGPGPDFGAGFGPGTGFDGGRGRGRNNNNDYGPGYGSDFDSDLDSDFNPGYSGGRGRDRGFGPGRNSRPNRPAAPPDRSSEGYRPRPRPAPSPTPTPARSKNRPGPSSGRCGRTIEVVRIFGGTNAELGQFPWQAALFYRSSSGSERVACGGALVNERYVVTAAHCLHPTIIKNERLVRVRLGELDTSSASDCAGSRCAPPALDFEVETQLMHPEYVARERPQEGRRHNEADIALLRLDRPAPYTEYVRPVCLPGADAASRDMRKQVLIAAGWGRTETRSSSDRLLFVQLEGRPLDECRSRLKVDVQATQLCVAGGVGKDSCNGDSGGPLLATGSQDGDMVFQLVGLVSFGGPCGDDRPAVYTRVAAFLPWLRENMRP